MTLASINDLQTPKGKSLREDREDKRNKKRKKEDKRRKHFFFIAVRILREEMRRGG